MDGGGVRRKACARCQSQRSRCGEGCIFAPYFPPDWPERFTKVHEVFSAKNVQKMLETLPMDKRAIAVTNMFRDAITRLEDPVNGCAGKIEALERQVQELKNQRTALEEQVWLLQSQLVAPPQMLVNGSHTRRVDAGGPMGYRCPKVVYTMPELVGGQTLQGQPTAPQGEVQMPQSHAGGGRV